MSVDSKDLSGPTDFVLDSLSRWLTGGPEFEVFRPIVVSYSIDVVDIFVGEQWPSEDLFHDKAVFRDVLACASSDCAIHIPAFDGSLAFFAT